MVDSGTVQGKWLGSRLRRLTCALFEHWADDRVGKIAWAALRRRMGPVRRKVQRLLLRGSQSGDPDVRGTCRELYEHRQWLWTFLRHERVEPTNNAGERSLRHAVIWRKLSFRTQSAGGSRFVGTMLTVIETCRQRCRNVFAYLTTAVEAHLARQPAPSLLPGLWPVTSQDTKTKRNSKCRSSATLPQWWERCRAPSILETTCSTFSASPARSTAFLL